MAVVDKVQAESSIRHDHKRAASQNWSGSYRRIARCLDFVSMLMAGVIAFVLRFPGAPTELNWPYVALTVVLPVVWVPTLVMCRAYQPRYVGVGYEEFHRVLRAGFVLTATVAIAAYATKTELARGYVVMALPLGTFLALVARYRLRKWLHKRRWNGEFMRRVVAVGHRTSVADLIKLLRALDLIEGLEGLVPEAVDRPVDQMRRRSERRQRAGSPRKRAPGKDAEQWRLGDEGESEG